MFSTPELVARHRDGPLAEERLAYLQHRSDLGSARRTLIDCATYLLAIAGRLRLPESIIARFSDKAGQAA